MPLLTVGTILNLADPILACRSAGDDRRASSESKHSRGHRPVWSGSGGRLPGDAAHRLCQTIVRKDGEDGVVSGDGVGEAALVQKGETRGRQPAPLLVAGARLQVRIGAADNAEHLVD